MLIRVTTISNACTPDITAKGVNTNASNRYVTIKKTAGEVLCLKFDNLDVIVTYVYIFKKLAEVPAPLPEGSKPAYTTTFYLPPLPLLPPPPPEASTAVALSGAP